MVGRVCKHTFIAYYLIARPEHIRLNCAAELALKDISSWIRVCYTDISSRNGLG
jgi:hypothetical protein